MTKIIEIQQEINSQLTNKETFKALVDTTFKSLQPDLVKRAIMEGMMRGFKFADFLEKNVYAVPYGVEYSLVTSIDYSRKIGMRSGVCGVDEPIYTYKIVDDKTTTKIESCKITVKRLVDGRIGDYTAKVYFDEYYRAGRSGKPSLWDTKPHTMIAKVAEMHALRKACPEELSKAYIEEEMEKEVTIISDESKITDEILKSVADAKTLDDLKIIYKKHEGLGKEFAKLVSDRKAEIKKESDKPKTDDKNS